MYNLLPVSEIIDTRSSDQKMQDILRTWFSALIKMGPMSETKFVTKTLSRDISLISGPALVKVSSGARFVIFRTLPNVANFSKFATF